MSACCSAPWTCRTSPSRPCTPSWRQRLRAPAGFRSPMTAPGCNRCWASIRAAHRSAPTWRRLCSGASGVCRAGSRICPARRCRSTPAPSATRTAPPPNAPQRQPTAAELPVSSRSKSVANRRRDGSSRGSSRSPPAGRLRRVCPWLVLSRRRRRAMSNI